MIWESSREGLARNHPLPLKSQVMKLITLIISSFVLFLSGCQIADTLGIGSAKKEASPAKEGAAPAEKEAPAPKK